MFTPRLIEIPFDAIQKPNVVFLDVDFVPVVDLMDEEMGVIALDDPVRTFPCEEAYLKGVELTREQFAQRFPRVAQRFFVQPAARREAA
ncbi:MAG: hypothetical protein P9F19_11080 [Candidatus Contendobacter sp.]|nr:hypothetical protein [Candidatus Contendobacter sp.]MDG4557911.1 hypothetical protein [Candidatus Contendobacter sp.]